MTKLVTYADVSPTDHLGGPVASGLSSTHALTASADVHIYSLKVSFGMHVHLKLLETAHSKIERTVLS